MCNQLTDEHFCDLCDGRQGLGTDFSGKLKYGFPDRIIPNVFQKLMSGRCQVANMKVKRPLVCFVVV